MWGKTKSTKNASKSLKISTLVGKDTQINGDLHFIGGLHIEGVVKGNVFAEDEDNAVLILSENGCIEGEVKVPHVVLNGTVVGNVYATSEVELAVNARVSGNVYYNMIEMAMGAEVNGSLVHMTDADKTQEEIPSDSDEFQQAG